MGSAWVCSNGRWNPVPGRAISAGHALRIRVTVEFGEAGKVEQDLIDQVNGILGKVKQGWKVGAT